MGMGEGSARRGAERFETSRPFHATADGVKFEGLLKDISETGASLEISTPLKEGQVLEIDVEDAGRLTATGVSLLADTGEPPMPNWPRLFCPQQYAKPSSRTAQVV